MNHLDKDEILILSETRGQRSDEPQDSTFRRNILRTRSASISIPMASLDPYETQPNLVGHTGQLRTTRKTPVSQMRGPLYATPAIGNPFQKISTFDGTGRNEHLLRSGQLGMCNDFYCTTCPTYLKVAQQRKLRASIFDHKFHNSLHGDPKGFGRKLFAFCSSCIPGVMNPHTKVVQQWNSFLAIICMVTIFVDTLFSFTLYVNKDNKCIQINMAVAKTLAVYRSISDFVFLLNILLQFRLAYVSFESRDVCDEDLVDHPRKIAVRYLLSYFFLDIFVVLPLPQILILIILPNSLGSPGSNLLSLSIFLQLPVKLLRFLPMFIGRYCSLESAVANLISGLLILMLYAHGVGSSWYLFALMRVNQCLQDPCHLGCMDLLYGRSEESNMSATWINDASANACLNSTSDAFSYGIYANAIPLTLETDMINKFVYALFWGFQQVITMAGNQTPSYFVWEVLFTLCIMVSGLVLLAILIGNIQSFNQSFAKRNLKKICRGRDVEQWMTHRRLPDDLKRRVRQAEGCSWAATRGVTENMVLENLPDDLQKGIRRHLFKFVNKVRIFSLMAEDDPILDAIRERLMQTTYIKGSRILSRGGLVQKMVFIMRGKLESIGEDGILVPLSVGDACGEELLRWYLEQSSESKEGERVKIQGLDLVSDRTVVCLTNVEAFSLNAKDIEEVTTHFPRLMRNPCVQHVIRYESPYWRSLAAKRIQVAWRNRKKRLSQANTTQNDYQTLRYESPYGKSHRANRIQVAWTNRKKRLRRANTTH